MGACVRARPLLLLKKVTDILTSSWKTVWSYRLFIFYTFLVIFSIIYQYLWVLAVVIVRGVRANRCSKNFLHFHAKSSQMASTLCKVSAWKAETLQNVLSILDAFTKDLGNSRNTYSAEHRWRRAFESTILDKIHWDKISKISLLPPPLVKLLFCHALDCVDGLFRWKQPILHDPSID